MKFLRAVLPNVTIALNISLLVIIYLDMRNPMMGFLMGAPFLTLAGLCAASSIATAVVLYADWRGGRQGRAKAENTENKYRKISNNT